MPRAGRYQRGSVQIAEVIGHVVQIVAPSPAPLYKGAIHPIAGTMWFIESRRGHWDGKSMVVTVISLPRGRRSDMYWNTLRAWISDGWMEMTAHTWPSWEDAALALYREDVIGEVVQAGPIGSTTGGIAPPADYGGLRRRLCIEPTPSTSNAVAEKNVMVSSVAEGNMNTTIRSIA